MVSGSDGEGEHFGCCPESVLWWTFVKTAFKMHPEWLTGKEEEAVGQAGHKSDWLCLHAQVCFTPSFGAASCEWSCTLTQVKRSGCILCWFWGWQREHRGRPRLSGQLGLAFSPLD